MNEEKIYIAAHLAELEEIGNCTTRYQPMNN